MAMKHPKHYKTHNEALERFCIVFNKVAQEKGGLLRMPISTEENFYDDGKIIYLSDGEHILFDFEKGINIMIPLVNSDLRV